MPYFQADDIPMSTDTNPRPHLRLISPEGAIILSDVKSFKIREYYHQNYGIKIGCKGKKVWRDKLTNLGYKIEKEV